MKIWIINHYALSPESAGGTRHYDFASRLSEQGHDVLIIASSFNHWTKKDEHCQNKEVFSLNQKKKVSFLWLKTPPYAGNLGRFVNMLVFSWRVMRGVGLKETPRPDVIIGSSPHLFAAQASLWLARKLNSSFVLEIRDLWPQSLIDLGSFPTWHPMVKILLSLEKSLYKNSDHIVTLLPGAISHISDLSKSSSDKITWIPNGVELVKIPAQKTIKNNDINVVYAGSHGLANDLDNILDAIEILEREACVKNLKFSFYGRGPDKKRLQDRAEQMGLKSLCFYPAIPKEDIYNVLQIADFFIVSLKDSPLYKYGISLNKLYDFLAMSKPVVMAGSPQNNPVLESGAGLVAPPGNPSAMAEALKKMVSMPHEQRTEIGKKGREFVSCHHDIKSLAKQLERICFEAVQ